MKKKIALITGGSTGIGASVAEELSEAGIRVAICDVNEKAGTELAPVSPEGEGNIFVPWKTGHWMIYPGKIWHRPGIVQSQNDRYIVAADMEF